MATVEINGQDYEVHEEVAEQLSKFIRRSKEQKEKIEDLSAKIESAINSVIKNEHHEDIGYDVLCSLGHEC